MIKGLTLTELLVVLVLVSIIAIWAIPSQKFFFDKSNDQVVSSQLLRAINLARSESIMRGVPITLCKSVDQKTCSGEWQNGCVILDDKQVLFAFKNNISGNLHWRAFPLNRNYLQFLPNGLTDAENGTFWYCAKSSKNPAWAIMLSQSGRARLVYPKQDEPIIDDKGKALSCAKNYSL